jgi:hypothetical protein
MGHLVKWDTCLSRPQAKRVGGAPAIKYSRVKSESRGESVQSKGLYPYYLSAISMMPSPLSPIHYKSADKAKVIKMTIY